MASLVRRTSTFISGGWRPGLQKSQLVRFVGAQRLDTGGVVELWAPRTRSNVGGNSAERPLEEALARAEANMISKTHEMWTEDHKPNEHELWAHPRAQEVKDLAEIVRTAHPPRGDTGYGRCLATNLVVRRLAGDIAVDAISTVGGVTTRTRQVRFDYEQIATLSRQSEEIATDLQTFVAVSENCTAAAFDATKLAKARDLLAAAKEASSKAMTKQRASYQKKLLRHSANLAKKHGFTRVHALMVNHQEVDDRGWPTLPDERPWYRWAGLRDGPFFDRIMRAYVGSKHTAVRSTDHGIADTRKAIGYEEGECFLIELSMPKLRAFPWIIASLRTDRNWDHIHANARATVSIFDSSGLDPGFSVFRSPFVPRAGSRTPTTSSWTSRARTSTSTTTAT